MTATPYQKKTKTWRKCTSSFVAFTFFSSLIFGPATGANAQYITNLPKPGEMVLLSPAFEPAVLKGMTLHPENPLQFDFIVDRGQDNLSGDALKAETEKLLKYFLAAMTIPDDDAWVNLSPYEGDRIIPDMLGATDMGKGMLEQDYLLKQLSASLTNPQEEIGKKFWNTVYKKAYEKFGTTTIPINTFNKVWITPDRAVILEQDGYVFIGETHLKVMLDEDYTAIKENLKSKKFGTDQITKDKVEELSAVSSEVVREIIIPELEKEINHGKNFAAVRQMYHSVILATWYKQTLKNSLLGKIYVDKNKIGGVDIDEKDLKQKIYEQYLAAFRKGVYNLIKEDYDMASKETLPRKYFSGGLMFGKAASSAIQMMSPGDAAAQFLIRNVRNDMATNGDGRYSTTFVQFDEQRAIHEIERVAQRLAARAAQSRNQDYSTIDQQVNILADAVAEQFIREFNFSPKNQNIEGAQEKLEPFLTFMAAVVADPASARAKLNALTMTEFDLSRKLIPVMAFIEAQKQGATPVEIGNIFIYFLKLTDSKINERFGRLESASATELKQDGASSSSVRLQQAAFQQKLTAVYDEKGMDEPSRAYFGALLAAFSNPTKDQKPLIIRVGDAPPGNFKPSALLTQSERTNLLGLITYSQLLQEVTPVTGTLKYDVIFSSLDAGLGTSVGREQYVKGLGRDKVGAKGTDLGEEGIIPGGVVSIAEIKLLRLITDIEAGAYPVALGGRLTFQPVVSADSKPSYDELFQKPYLNDVLNPKSRQKPRTYGQVLKSLGVKIESKIVPFYPGLDIETYEPSWERESSGSHGEVGFKIMLDTLSMKDQDQPQFNVFLNGDGTNNMADNHILDWMAANNVPIVMVSTAKTALDKKGGQIGVEFVEGGQVRVKMLELASAKINGQQLNFEHVGLEGGIGEPGKQDFNTNIAVINQALLARILKDVLKEIFNGDVAPMQKIFTPDLIASEKPNDKGKMFVQLEGPIGTVLTNLHNYFATSKDPAVKRIMEKYKVDRMLRIVHVEANNRTRFFTPIKSALDFALQTNSDYYRLNRKTWMKEDTQPGVPLPIVNLVGGNSNDKYYEDVTNMTTSFGKFSVIGLKELDVTGRVLMPNAVFQGKVVINNPTGQLVDLTSFKDQLGTTANGRLMFKDVQVDINGDGTITTIALASSALKEVDLQVNGDGDDISTVNYNSQTLASSAVTRKKVLYLEDNVINQIMTEQVLRQSGAVKVDITADVDDALTKTQGADIILVDFNLGTAKTGLDFIEVIANSEGPKPQVFLMSTAVDAREELTQLKAGNPAKYQFVRIFTGGVEGKITTFAAFKEFEEQFFPDSAASSAVRPTTVLVVGEPLMAQFLFRRGHEVFKMSDVTAAQEMLNGDGAVVPDVIVANDEEFLKSLPNASKRILLVSAESTVNRQAIRNAGIAVITKDQSSMQNVLTIVSEVTTTLGVQSIADGVPTVLQLGDLTQGKDREVSITIPGRDKRIIVAIEIKQIRGEPAVDIIPYEEGDMESGVPIGNRSFRKEGDGFVKADAQPTDFRGLDFDMVGNNVVVTSNAGPGTIAYADQAGQAQQSVASSGAQANEATVGGIDFDPSLLNLQIKRNGKGVPLPLPQQNIENINIDGLYPVIINIQPATIQNFPFLLSSDKGKKVPELSMR